MKQTILDFCKRGLLAAGGGPVIMALVYAILGAAGVVETLTVWEVCRGILTVSLMAFIAAGISVVYQIDRLSLITAIGIHGFVLYLDYLLIYLVNGWLKSQIIPVSIFTGVFVIGYAVIWLSIWLGIRNKTHSINAKLKQKQT